MFAGLYSAGSLLVGLLLIIDNLVLLRRGGAFNVGPNGEALGLSFFLMIVETGWTGFSALAVFMSSRPALPAVYLVISALLYYAGSIEQKAKGIIRGVPLWFVRIGLGASILFTIGACYEVSVVYKLFR